MPAPDSRGSNGAPANCYKVIVAVPVTNESRRLALFMVRKHLGILYAPDVHRVEWDRRQALKVTLLVPLRDVRHDGTLAIMSDALSVVESALRRTELVWAGWGSVRARPWYDEVWA